MGPSWVAGAIAAGPDRWAAENTRHGIFLANGPDFTASGELDRISILDMAPTLLVAAGCDVPRDMTGEVLPIVAGDPDWGRRDPIRIDDGARAEAGDEVADRLQQLGYME